MNINILPQNDCIVNLFLQKNLLKNSYFFHFFINLRKKTQQVEKNEEKASNSQRHPSSLLLPRFRIFIALQYRSKVPFRALLYIM